MNFQNKRSPVFVLFLLTALSACRHLGEPSLTYRLVLPDGYVGWVRVDFGVDSAPAVFKRNGNHEVATIKVGEDGRARTSDIEVILAPKTEYEFSTTQVLALSRYRKSL